MSIITHCDSLEFGIAEKIWDEATDEKMRARSIYFYELACSKNDARAFLALYDIYSHWHYRHLLTDTQLGGERYFEAALKLGHPAAFLFGGNSAGYTYYRLIYLSTGMAAARQSNHYHLSTLQNLFISLSANFAKEFLPEILRRADDWKPGDGVNLSRSEFDGRLIQHPNKFNPNADIKPGWLIFPMSESISQYLQRLPGYEDYLLACNAEDCGDSDLWKMNLKNALNKGNGQAAYALSAHMSTDQLIRCAESGSPDAFNDLFEELAETISNGESLVFKNTSELRPAEHITLMALINSLVYLFTIMERLGIGKYADYAIDVYRLWSESDSDGDSDRDGYSNESANLFELKYELCNHQHICEINERARRWKIGEKFDSKFLSDFEVANKY